MPSVRAALKMPGLASEAEALWYDPQRWPAWIDGFGHVVKLEGEWPGRGARAVWDSKPGGRGRVAERVTAYEARAGQTLAVEDEQLTGTQRVTFAPGQDEVEVALELDVRAEGLQRLHAADRRAVHPARAARLAQAQPDALRA